MYIRILGIITCLLLAAGSAAAQSGIVITTDTVLVESPDAPGPVKKAVEDLANDMKKVFGKGPAIRAEAQGTAIEVAAPTGGSAESFSIAAHLYCKAD